MDWLPSKAKSTIRFRAMMESGQMVDEVADIVQTQVIAHKARASIRNRDAVPLYYQTEENRPPVWRENLLVETGLSPQPGMDSRYVLEDSLNLWKGIKTGAVEVDGESKVRMHTMGIASIIASILVFFACAWYAGLDKTQVEAAAPEEVQETVIEEEFGVVEYLKEDEQEGDENGEGSQGPGVGSQ